ncbi:tetratricopeptide repeat protein [Ectothiorhodospiraceae bacterium WFHF3C12]|nr:tetratricopeptide repeat protein [Ectothiorhodospiraceae bacterium WFHF3C12]
MDIDALEAMLDRGQDGAMLRLTLGRAYRERGEMELAERHLGEAVRQKPDYAAAWKSLAQCQEAAGRDREALASYRGGLESARANGDMQLVKEMEVFSRRLERRLDNAAE